VALLALAGTALVTAPAAHAAKKQTSPAPTITRIAPKEIVIGQTLTIRGRHFRPGKGKTSVAFQKAGGKVQFVKADLSTTKLIRVAIPATLQAQLTQVAGAAVPTRFRLRILTTRFGKKFTSAKLSPKIAPAPIAGTVDTSTSGPNGDCDGDGQRNGVDGDDDNDLLPDALELRLGLSTCNADSDGDGVEDGFEYQSAIDLNDDNYQNPNTVLPYPAKRPYPNPLFADSTLDYDGDTLTLADEFKLWKYTTDRWAPRDLSALTYSDGKQYTRTISASTYQSAAADTSNLTPAQIQADLSNHKQWQFRQAVTAEGYDPNTLLDFNGFTVPDDVLTARTAMDSSVSDAESYYFDYNHDGRMRDDELDEDGDGLDNWNELHGFMTPDWWKQIYGMEVPYVITFAGTDPVDPDSDGDGVVDGADDQDHDDIPNVLELSRRMVADEDMTQPMWHPGQSASSIHWNRPLEDTVAQSAPSASQPKRAWVNPFNPCLPNRYSRSCPVRVPVSGGWAPFTVDPDQIFWVLN
jgi:hypothetical protein